MPFYFMSQSDITCLYVGKLEKKQTVLGCSGFSCSVKKVKVKDGSLPWIIQEVSRLTRASGDAIAGISIRV